MNGLYMYRFNKYYGSLPVIDSHESTEWVKKANGQNTNTTQPI